MREAQTHICRYCGEEFKHKTSGGTKNWFCSRQCASKYLSEKVQERNRLKEIEPKVYKRTCKQCNKVFETTYKNKRTTCSYECENNRYEYKKKMYRDNKRQKYQSIAKEKKCIVCGSKFMATTWSKETCSNVCSSTLKKVQKNNSNHRRRKRKISQSDGSVDMSFLLSLRKVKNCYWCSTKITKENFTVDHIHPLAKGGLHSKDNLVVACFNCNSNKRDLDPLVFANSIGKLL